MRNDLQSVYQITKQLEEALESQVTNKNRSDMINKVNELLEQRQEHLNYIHPPYTEKEKKVGKQIVLMNKHIHERMQFIFNDLKKDMQQIKQQRKSTNTYTNPYKSVQTIDGMFMDSKQ